MRPLHSAGDEMPADARYPAGFVIRTPAQALECARVAARVCADAWRAQLALAELLTNAVEHGSLGLGLATKRALVASGTLEAEIARRLAMPLYASRKVRLLREPTPAGWCFDLADDGDGFDWQPWFADVKTRNKSGSGRGIQLLLQLGFSDLHYVGRGNRVRLWVADAGPGYRGVRRG